MADRTLSLSLDWINYMTAIAEIEEDVGVECGERIEVCTDEGETI